MAQWTRRRPSKSKIAGSSPAEGSSEPIFFHSNNHHWGNRIGECRDRTFETPRNNIM